MNLLFYRDDVYGKLIAGRSPFAIFFLDDLKRTIRLSDRRIGALQVDVLQFFRCCAPRRKLVVKGSHVVSG